MDDEARFRELFEATYGVVRRYAYHRGASEGVADDVVAQTFLVAWRRLDDVPDDDPVPWLLAVARNVGRNERRGGRRRLALVHRLAAPRPVPPPPEPADGAGVQAVHAALAGLDTADQEILRLVAWDDLTPAQAATVLGCSPGAARVRLHRARRRLAAELAKRSSAGGQIGSEEPIERGARP
ncbi:MAG: RNA polymerase sigma factor [Acidimicrobiales bacterium]